jgi:hypothetical protein
MMQRPTARHALPAPLALLAVLALGVAAAWAQGKPDFSGTWKLAGTTPPNYPGSAGWGVPSQTLVVKQTPTEVTIQSGQYGASPMSVVYKLDGSDNIWEAPSVTQSGATAVVRWRTKARWDGTKLILFTWNTALNQMRDVMSVSNGALTIQRGTEQPGPSTNATLTYNK